MLVFLGNLHMRRGDYKLAVQSFERAEVKLGARKERPPLIISLVHTLPPRNVLKLIPISYRFRGGNLMI